MVSITITRTRKKNSNQYEYYTNVFEDYDGAIEEIAISRDYTSLHECIIDALKWYPQGKITDIYT